MSKHFSRMYARVGRPPIPPEKLLRALLLQILYTIRSERILMEQLNYNLLFRWFVGLNLDDEVWDVTVFTKNRERLLKGDVAGRFFQLVVEEARALKLMSDEHFTVDGTLLEACASLKSFKKIEEAAPKEGKADEGDPGNPTVDFHGEKRSNEVKRHFVCKRWTIGKADESSIGTPWSAKRRRGSDRLKSRLRSLP